MGTRYHVKLFVASNFKPSQTMLQIQIDRILEEYNQVMSTYISDSELSLLNRHEEGEWIVVSDRLFSLLSLSVEVSKRTGGAFDVTVGPLVNLWGFGPDSNFDEPPSANEVDDMRQLVGYDKIELNYTGRQVRKKGNIQIDLSAIAKGHAADIVSEALLGKGVKNFMVEIGGELRVSGKNSREKPWVIGIERPHLIEEKVKADLTQRALDASPVQIVGISNVGMATSGDYRNYYEKNGVRFSHTIDPVSARPITHNLASVTVIADSAAIADAEATAINVMGPDIGFKYAQKQGIAAFFIIRESDGFSVKYTPEFDVYRSSFARGQKSSKE